MLIDCPHCARSYHIARASLGKRGRKMRCAGCREVWHASASDVPQDAIDDCRARPLNLAEEPHAGIEISGDATSERATAPCYEELYGTQPAPPPAKPARRRPLPRLPLGLVAGALALAASMTVLGARAAIVRHLPATASLYAGIGLPVNLRGLELRHVTSTLIGEGAQRVLAIEGDIANITRTEASLPLLLVSVRGADKTGIYSWTTPAPQAKLNSGETIAFRARLAAPPDNARDVVVRFQDDRPKTKEARR